MARRKSTTNLELENERLRKELESLRGKVEAETTAKAAMKHALAAKNAGATTPWTELVVGIRNISDYTIGIPPIQGGSEYQLSPAFTGKESGTTAILPYSEWRELRNDSRVAKGMIKRDDSILGSSFNAAPEDREEDLPASARVNQVEDPKAWIDFRSEDEIRRDLEAMTSTPSIFRLRRVVDDALRELEAKSGMPRETLDQQAACAQYALRQLSGKLRLVDELTTSIIERRNEPDPAEVKGTTVTIRL